MKKLLMLFLVCCVAPAGAAYASVVPHAVERLSVTPHVSLRAPGDGLPVSTAFDIPTYAPPLDGGPSLASSFRSSSGYVNYVPSTTTPTTQIDFDYDRSISTATPATPVPEPVTVVLLGVGLLGGGWAARKRRANRQ